jgi:hypothetical protein
MMDTRALLGAGQSGAQKVSLNRRRQEGEAGLWAKCQLCSWQRMEGDRVDGMPMDNLLSLSFRQESHQYD